MQDCAAMHLQDLCLLSANGGYELKEAKLSALGINIPAVNPPCIA